MVTSSPNTEEGTNEFYSPSRAASAFPFAPLPSPAHCPRPIPRFLPVVRLLFRRRGGEEGGRKKGVVRPFPRCIARNHTAKKAHQAREREYGRKRLRRMCCWRAPFSAEERATSVAFICLRITVAVAGPAEQALFIQRRRRRRYLGKGKLGQTLELPHLICLLCPLFHRLSILILSRRALPLSFSPTSAPRGRRIHDNSIPVRNEPAPSARPSVRPSRGAAIKRQSCHCS